VAEGGVTSRHCPSIRAIGDSKAGTTQASRNVLKLSVGG